MSRRCRIGRGPHGAWVLDVLNPDGTRAWGSIFHRWEAAIQVADKLTNQPTGTMEAPR